MSGIQKACEAIDAIIENDRNTIETRRAQLQEVQAYLEDAWDELTRKDTP